MYVRLACCDVFVIVLLKYIYYIMYSIRRTHTHTHYTLIHCWENYIILFIITIWYSKHIHLNISLLHFMVIFSTVCKCFKIILYNMKHYVNFNMLRCGIIKEILLVISTLYYRVYLIFFRWPWILLRLVYISLRFNLDQIN